MNEEQEKRLQNLRLSNVYVQAGCTMLLLAESLLTQAGKDAKCIGRIVEELMLELAFWIGDDEQHMVN